MKVPLSLQARAVRSGLFAVFREPYYVLIVFLTALIGILLSLWLLNLDLLGFVLFDAPFDLLTKLSYLFSILHGLFSIIDAWRSIVLVLFGVLFGLNAALLTYVIRKRIKGRGKGQGLGGLALGVVSGGCAACGASILVPLLTTFGVTSAQALQGIGNVIAIISIVLLGWSAWLVSMQAATKAKK